MSLPTVRMYATAGISSKKLEGKTAVVTASTDGIGLAIARSFAENGANVVVSSRKQTNVTKAVELLKSEGHKGVTGVVCHVANAEDRKKLFQEAVDKFGGVDILVSNAAVNPTVGNVLDCDERAWDKIFEINVKCAFLLAKEAAPLIKKRGGGSIIFVSSIAGFQPFKILGAYSVSKTALLGLTKAAAQDLAPDNIRVNCLAPGIVETRFSSALHETESAKDAAIATVPLQRLAKPKEMGGVVTFLCSEDASYITGETIIAAGGVPSRL